MWWLYSIYALDPSQRGAAFYLSYQSPRRRSVGCWGFPETEQALAKATVISKSYEPEPEPEQSLHSVGAGRRRQGGRHKHKLAGVLIAVVFLGCDRLSG